MATCPFGADSFITCPITKCVLWWLVGSTFLWMMWNQVLMAHLKLKKATFKQALITVATLCILFCGPRMMRGYGHHHGGSSCCGGKHGKACPMDQRHDHHADEEGDEHEHGNGHEHEHAPAPATK